VLINFKLVLGKITLQQQQWNMN